MHTSGPWNWDEGQGVITKEWNGFPWHVATVDMSELGWHEDDRCKSRENGANARLIAAAPEMLEAIEEAVSNAHKNYQGSIEISGDAFEMLRDALAKAKGGA